MPVVSNNAFPILVKNTFQTIEEYSTALTGLGLDSSQLSRGDFNGHSKVIISPSFQLAIREADAQHLQKATIKNGYIGMIFPLVQNEYINNGLSLGPEKQYIIFNGDENKLIIPEKHKHISLVININGLKEYFSEAEIEILLKTFREMSSGVISSNQKLLFSQKLYNLFESLKRLNNNAADHRLAYEDSYDSLFYSLNNYQHAHVTSKIERIKNNERLLSRALEYIHSESLQNLTVSSLVSNTHASSRSIQYCFSELLGMSPKKYIIRLRLNAIRKELRKNNQSDATITNIANNYGVVNIGRFKQDYQKFFNETPRETLFRN